MAKERDEINRGDKIEPREITAELRESYLDYAMSVIVGRALPDVRDGLKPVHRRILWAMQELGLTAGSKFMKSARVVGETMGKFHPHGDMAVYDALVRMAQPFSLRYPLITGQGNFGSVDGDGAAAQRYTEVRLSPIAEDLLTDIDKDTVDFAPNYDDSRKEPVVMPAKFPNLLVNGSEGIAVGMATKIPPHNLSEVINASIHLIDSPKATAEELMEFVQGPDFPTGGIIYDRKAIVEAYTSGRGSITSRATVEIENRRIVVSEIPYQVNKSELIMRIAELVQEKRIEGIRDLRDESDKDGLRITIDLKSDSVPEKVLNQLWRHTDLQKDYHLNMVALAEGLQPQTMSIRDVLLGFVLHRKEVVTRRTKFELKRAEERAHILEGLAKALSQIDKVLERQKIEDELKEKLQLIKDLKLLLKSPEKILGVIKRELKELDGRFGDLRRTKLKVGALKELADEDMIPQEEAIITQTHDGYIKRLPPGTFKRQRRGGKGVKGGITNEADVLTHFIGAHTHDDILFFTDKGRVFQTKVYEIPSASRVSKGQMIHNFLGISANEKVSAIVTYGSEEKKSNPYLVIVTAGGVIKKTGLDKFENVRRSGILAVNLSKGDELKWAKLAGSKDEIVMTTAAGRAIRFKGGDVRAMGRTAGGVRGITLKKGDRVSSFDLVAPMKDARFLVVMANGYAKQTPLKEYKLQRRGGQGILTAKVTSKTGQVVSAHVIIEQTELLALSAKGLVLRTSIKSIRSAGRATQGVRIMKLGAGDKIIGTVAL
ncbi:MAG: DNA gyrase subunit A [Candidatus Colwellbacteria bacterium]|nr:DNA gyrase subunit A [Candidatus Colwellbacteria bacterium]